MTILKATCAGFAVAGLLLASSAQADTRAGDVSPRAAIASRVAAAPKVTRRSQDSAAYASYDSSATTGLIAGLGGAALGAGLCLALKCGGHTSP